MIVIRKASDIEEANLKARLPEEICHEVEAIARLLDDLYGEARDTDSDGGVIVIAERKSDLKTIKAQYASLNENDCEGEVIIASPKGNYVNQLYLSNNEYGVNVIMPELFIRKETKA